jgi:hypothetical protein
VPDLILAADVGRDGKPAPSPDPAWEPDLILAEAEAPERRSTPPPNPTWKPDVILRDEVVDRPARFEACDPPGKPASYQSFLRAIAARAACKSRERWLTRGLRAILALILVACILGTIWLCKVAWDESVAAARENGRTDPYGGLPPVERN